MSSWTSTSTITGVTPSVPGALATAVTYIEKYETKVDEAGTVKTPFGDFPAMRLNLLLTRTVTPTLILTTRTFTFSAECYGTVAKVVSDTLYYPATAPAEFSTAAELSRLSL